MKCHMHLSTSNNNNSPRKLSFFQSTMLAGDQKLRGVVLIKCMKFRLSSDKTCSFASQDRLHLLRSTSMLLKQSHHFF